ncbi:hypothetical protein Peur_073208 [Populus x canadensis]
MISNSHPPSLPLRHRHHNRLLLRRSHRLLFTVGSSSTSSIQEALEEKNKRKLRTC